MKSTKVKFQNENGDNLVGYLELPVNQEPHNFVLFAHCFTCNKNFFAVKNISTALTTKGFGVLRFDFTGLGESQGDFEDTNFSANIGDLVVAANFLRTNYSSPALLIGHSLGGAAALFAAKEIKEVKAVATIGTPATLTHVKHLLEDELDQIKELGMASVNIGGRPFKIKKQFLDDLEKQNLTEIIPRLNKAVLIMHSPQDSIVAIKNAEELYIAARHPKSFVSLDGADHLLSKKEDSTYVGSLIGTWALRYLETPGNIAPKSKHDIVAQLGPEGYTTQIKAGNHQLISDEPVDFGGKDFGPSPYEYLSAALAACTSMTIQMYARRKGWPLQTVETHVNHMKSHATDCENCESTTAKIDVFERAIIVTGELDEKQKNRLLQIAEKCPVHKTLHQRVEINTSMMNKKNGM